jgi:hypothetical protein
LSPWPTRPATISHASELACAGERAEEVGRAFVHEPAGCAVGIGIYCRTVSFQTRLDFVHAVAAEDEEAARSV